MSLRILQVGDVLLSPDILTEYFCCDLDVCKGACCIEGDAGAPVTLDEVMAIEDELDTVWADLSASAQSVIDHQGVAYTDREGDLVTSIVRGKDCVFTCYTPTEEPETKDDAKQHDDEHTLPPGCCLCALEKAHREGRCSFVKPISCALYPIRVKEFTGGLVGLNYHRWDVCRCAREKGRELQLPLYRFLKEPLIRRFGEQWYAELLELADSLREQGYLSGDS